MGDEQHQTHEQQVSFVFDRPALQQRLAESRHRDVAEEE